jgi:hypothetical protein
VDPTSSGRRLKLAAFVDYKKTEGDEPVIINISGIYFLQYNRAKVRPAAAFFPCLSPSLCRSRNLS